MGNYNVVSITDIAPMKPKIDVAKQNEKELLELVDKGIAETKRDLMENVLRPFKEACIAVSLENDAIEDDMIFDEETGTTIYNKRDQGSFTSTDQDLRELLEAE